MDSRRGRQQTSGDDRGGSIAFGYTRAAIQGSGVLAAHIQEIRKTEMELDNMVTIAVYPCSYRAPRGVTVLCGICDEVGFWRDENSANPDREKANFSAHDNTCKLLIIPVPVQMC